MIRHAHVVRRRVLEPRLGDLPAVSRVCFHGAYGDKQPQPSSLTLIPNPNPSPTPNVLVTDRGVIRSEHSEGLSAAAQSVGKHHLCINMDTGAEAMQ